VICKWIAGYREGGIEALIGTKAAGPAPTLDGQQLSWLYRVICSNNPPQLGFEFALWTRAMAREPIRDRFGVRYRLRRETRTGARRRPSRHARSMSRLA